jgi:hypothetical protein
MDDYDLPTGFRWATADECEGYSMTPSDYPDMIVVPRTHDVVGKRYTDGEADLALPEGFRCAACDRPEDDCSKDPCPDVIADREEEPPVETGIEGHCRHCGRRVVKDIEGRWVDPEATGDDSVWRETCDAHEDDFVAAHEPVEEKPHKRTDELKVDDVFVVGNDVYEVWTQPVPSPEEFSNTGRWEWEAKDMRTERVLNHQAQPGMIWEIR